MDWYWGLIIGIPIALSMGIVWGLVKGSDGS